eukprot:1083540-Rhodomonas_salina.5
MNSLSARRCRPLQLRLRPASGCLRQARQRACSSLPCPQGEEAACAGRQCLIHSSPSPLPLLSVSFRLQGNGSRGVRIALVTWRAHCTGHVACAFGSRGVRIALVTWGAHSGHVGCALHWSRGVRIALVTWGAFGSRGVRIALVTWRAHSGHVGCALHCRRGAPRRSEGLGGEGGRASRSTLP